MHKLTRSQLAARDALYEALTERFEDLENAVSEFNETLLKAWDAVEVAQNRYNESVADANDWLGEIAGEIEVMCQHISGHSVPLAFKACS